MVISIVHILLKVFMCVFWGVTCLWFNILWVLVIPLIVTMSVFWVVTSLNVNILWGRCLTCHVWLCSLVILWFFMIDFTVGLVPLEFSDFPSLLIEEYSSICYMLNSCFVRLKILNKDMQSSFFNAWLSAWKN